MKLSKIRTFDSLHIAAAEEAKADVLLTTDDKLEKMAEKLELKVKVMNPLKFAWEKIQMSNVNLNSLLEIRMIGMQALRDALGPVGMVRFIQQYETGYGDYTKEKQNEPDADLDELDALLNMQAL